MKVIFIVVNFETPPEGEKNDRTIDRILQERCNANCQEMTVQINGSTLSFYKLKISDDKFCFVLRQNNNISHQNLWNKIKKEIQEINEIYIAYHSSWISDNLDVQTNMESMITNKYSQAKIYTSEFSRESKIQLWVRVSEIIKNPNEDNFELLVERIRTPLKSSERIRMLKHRIMNLFSPIDIDLQGLIEKDFDEKYWNAVVENKNINQLLTDVRSVIYDNGESIKNVLRDEIGESLYRIWSSSFPLQNAKNQAKGFLEGRERENLSSLFQDENILFQIKKLLTVWDKLSEFLPNDGDIPDKNVKTIFDNFNENGREKVKKIVKRNNPFKKWLKELESILEELIGVLECQLS